GHLVVLDSGDDFGHPGGTIRMVNVSTGGVWTIAGARDTREFEDGIGSQARFFKLEAITAKDGFAYVIDEGAIRRIDLSVGRVTTLAGSLDLWTSIDGPGAVARFYFPRDLSIGRDGELFVTEEHAVR